MVGDSSTSLIAADKNWVYRKMCRARGFGATRPETHCSQRLSRILTSFLVMNVFDGRFHETAFCIDKCGRSRDACQATEINDLRSTAKILTKRCLGPVALLLRIENLTLLQEISSKRVATPTANRHHESLRTPELPRAYSSNEF